jgi:hypothetical protein
MAAHDLPRSFVDEATRLCDDPAGRVQMALMAFACQELDSRRLQGKCEVSGLNRATDLIESSHVMN